MSNITSGNQFDQKKAVDMIEIMEVLASQMDFDVHQTFPELKDMRNQASDGLPWGNWSALLRRDLHEDFFSLLYGIMEMKGMLFEASQLPEICKPVADCAAVCQYCNWILARCGRGLHDPEAADHSGMGDKFNHLCAIDYFPDFEDLKARSTNGCEFCRFLRNALLSPGAIDYEYCNYRDVTDLSTEPFFVWIQWRWKQPSESQEDASNTLCCLTLKLWSSTVLFGQDRWDFCIESENATLSSKLSLYRPPQLDALSPPNIAFIQKQLGVPRRDVHTRSISDTFLPRRLVDLGIFGGSLPRLVDSSNRGHACKYATLSYCWGPQTEAKQQLKLTHETRERFYHEIPLQTMTPVLHDTVAVCRALGIRYIWIDALCILQGDKTDWEEQSSHMHMIFQHSYVTICTPASSSCMQGFLHRTSENCRPSIRIPYVDEISNEVFGVYTLRPTLGTGQNRLSRHHPFVFPMLTAEQRDMSISTWASRGWVFQERFLSSTKIVFGATMLHIRQDGVVMSENGELTSPEPHLGTVEELSKLQTMDSLSTQGRYMPDYWYDIIEQYSSTRWTERLDLLPALSGIAALFQQAMQDQYLVGLWQKDLYCGLLWHTGTTKARSPKSLGELLVILNGDELQIGPSWSWVSRPDFMEFDISTRVNRTCRVRSHLRPEFTLLSSTISVDGVNPLGRVQKASLKICGFLVRLRAGCSPISVDRASKWMCKTSKGHTLFIDPDWRPRRMKSNGENVHKGDDDKLQLLIISSCCSDSPIPISEHSAHHPSMDETEDYATRVIYKPHYRRSFFEDKERTLEAMTDCSLCSEQGRRRDIWGLLIYPAGPEMTFYRVGVFICRAEFGGSQLFKEAERQVLELY
ncbi:HET-domain-containing protein [Polyplosphaeria fusca]|uniref:HET-domain-containing protein n=1 Tax=Polyplosphaeria fusca TaxID=682080 RepID=A0A9P4QRQ3_9PLEO|nr:HET-domain-containing protein [Polyplosphaeria fusca]